MLARMLAYFLLTQILSFFSFVDKPAIAQLVEHLTVECCSNQMVPGSIPGGRIYDHVYIASTWADHYDMTT